MAMDRSDRILYDIREPLFFFLEETYGKDIMQGFSEAEQS